MRQHYTTLHGSTRLTYTGALHKYCHSLYSQSRAQHDAYIYISQQQQHRKQHLKWHFLDTDTDPDFFNKILVHLLVIKKTQHTRL